MTYTVHSSDITALVNNNCTAELDGVPMAAGHIISSGTVLTVIANSGFIILSGYVTVGPAWNPSALNLALGDPPTTASVTFGANLPTTNDRMFPYSDSLVTEQGGVDLVANNNAYLVDTSILAEVSKKRFFRLNDVTYDRGEYIINVIQLPFAIDDDLVLEAVPIILGDEALTESAPEIATDKIIKSLGEIVVPDLYGDFRDYANTTAVLNLPYADPVPLNLENVIGETLTIEYEIDAYTGRATIRVFSTSIGGDTIHSSVEDMGIRIPYGGKWLEVENVGLDLSGDNKIMTPFLTITRNLPSLFDGFFTSPVIADGVLTNETGFIVVDEVNLNFQALASEKDAIRQALQSGVIIK